MLLEVVKPIALMLCLLSLGAVFYTAFLVPASDLEQRSWDSLALLSLAAGICLTSGMIFRESGETGAGDLAHTLPVQMFCWGTGLMLALFLASWYLETHCIFYKDLRRF
jgi:formate/nitrite transporter FocA (FNT family)